jgi:hypothetical protein
MAVTRPTLVKGDLIWFLFSVLLRNPAIVRYAEHVGKIRGTKNRHRSLVAKPQRKKDLAGDGNEDGLQV